MLVHHQVDCVEVSAPAKLNLYLEVLGKRPDGYHELETLMVTVNLFDTLTFRNDESSHLTLKNTWAGSAQARSALQDLPSGPQNLVLKAATLLAQVTGCSRGACISLQKRIPLAAGLAGGSTDAAATLLGLNLLWDLKLSFSELRDLGAKLGSDVPFFLAQSAAAVCRGRGEKIQPVKLPTKLHFVLAKPNAGLSTALVFQHCQPAKVPRDIQQMVQTLLNGNPEKICKTLWNRLEVPALGLCPQIAEIAREFSQLPLTGQLMSGSGTSYFGLCRHQQQARHLAGKLTALGIANIYSVSSCV